MERRGQAETDPIKKSRIANFLKEYWNVRQGSRSDIGENRRSSKDVADAIGESVDNTNSTVRKHTRVYEEYKSNRLSSNDLGLDALYHIATLPQEEREKELNDN